MDSEREYDGLDIFIMVLMIFTILYLCVLFYYLYDYNTNDDQDYTKEYYPDTCSIANYKYKNIPILNKNVYLKLVNSSNLNTYYLSLIKTKDDKPLMNLSEEKLDDSKFTLHINDPNHIFNYYLNLSGYRNTKKDKKFIDHIKLEKIKYITSDQFDIEGLFYELFRNENGYLKLGKRGRYHCGGYAWISTYNGEIAYNDIPDKNYEIGEFIIVDENDVEIDVDLVAKC